ncbi:hypothetical protein E1B28_010757 [Marasmius oreades]|uniref:Uncharacterized protein n=1 Tax=Marasmius oreades TaxID=181124 RepID=A0A9P7RT82_9AGAR|nr:uncharacterized protein E1B28_010757 [Marasmius oreades]KAG7089047.1 hypothetical protein E1B28_010757 [Marasmius oreades]
MSAYDIFQRKPRFLFTSFTFPASGSSAGAKSTPLANLFKSKPLAPLLVAAPPPRAPASGGVKPTFNILHFLPLSSTRFLALVPMQSNSFAIACLSGIGRLLHVPVNEVTPILGPGVAI